MDTNTIAKSMRPQALLEMLADAGRPGPEHKKLDPLVGGRDGADGFILTAKFWTDPSQPPPSPPARPTSGGLWRAASSRQT